MSVARQTTAEMDWCRVVGPRGLCGPLDEMQRFPTSNLPLTLAEKPGSVGRPGTHTPISAFLLAGPKP